MRKVTPMIFNADMVRALLDGSKTQTRRPINEYKYGICFCGGRGDSLNDPKIWGVEDGNHGGWVYLELPDDADRFNDCLLKRPFGEKGDLIYVRETFCDKGMGMREYRADTTHEDAYTWTPSIHMPRLASRLTLRITDVRAERLHGITEQNAIDEGCPQDIVDNDLNVVNTWYASLWESLYNNWDDNPWVWVYEFEVIHQNIDDVLNGSGK